MAKEPANDKSRKGMTATQSMEILFVMYGTLISNNEIKTKVETKTPPPTIYYSLHQKRTIPAFQLVPCTKE